uniref:Uncharacterized protein n=1 Tax=Knipowitschia caucasica TaxID=637954 RepID=A0AAV2J542_KNICA
MQLVRPVCRRGCRERPLCGSDLNLPRIRSADLILGRIEGGSAPESVAIWDICYVRQKEEELFESKELSQKQRDESSELEKLVENMNAYQEDQHQTIQELRHQAEVLVAQNKASELALSTLHKDQEEVLEEGRLSQSEVLCSDDANERVCEPPLADDTSEPGKEETPETPNGFNRVKFAAAFLYAAGLGLCSYISYRMGSDNLYESGLPFY